MATECERDDQLIRIAILNAMSERFAEVHLAAALGLPVTKSTFVFGLSWERDDKIRANKLRVLVASPELLDTMFDSESARDDITLERERHEIRVRTLAELHRLWKAESGCVGQIELGVRGTA